MLSFSESTSRFDGAKAILYPFVLSNDCNKNRTQFIASALKA